MDGAFAWGLLAAGGVKASVQNFSPSATAAPAIAFACRLATVATWRRTGAAMRLAELSHMLMKGFFFNQGLDVMAGTFASYWA